jgi:Flp pilus assembly protein TadG
MKSNKKIARRLFCDQDGAVALEFAIVSVVFIVMSLGVLEFGRALQVRNELTFAADFGAREVLMNADADDTTVAAAIREKFSGYNKDDLTVTIGTETVDGIDFRTLDLSYPLEIFIPGVTRSVLLTASRRTPEV